MKQLDLLLVNPGQRSLAYQSLAGETCAVEPPVWCFLLAAFAQRHGFRVEVLDANVDDLTAVEVAERVRDERPRLTAVVCYGQHPSASTQVMPAAIATAVAAKKLVPESRVLMVGGHVAALPERTLEESGADFACTGEGCYTILDLLQGKHPSDCRGLVWKSVVGPVSAVVTNRAAPNISDLDVDMPLTGLPLERMGRYRAHNWHCWGFGPRQPYMALYTTLGCPFRCSFCCIQAPFREGDRERIPLTALGATQLRQDKYVNSYRYWSPAQVGQTVARAHHDHGVSNFKIADEMFVLNRKHVIAVCDEIRKRVKNPHDRLNIWAYARIDTCNDAELLRTMRSTGFRWLGIGIESASESVRDGVAKGFAGEKIEGCLRRVKDAGIHVGANYIFGLPGDTYETMCATYELACHLNTPYANFYVAQCYPGSRLWDESPQEHGRGWSTFSQFGYDAQPMTIPSLSPREVLRFREEAFHGYHCRPEYLSMMQREFGAEAVAQVKQMESRHLKFRLLEEHPDGDAEPHSEVGAGPDVAERAGEPHPSAAQAAAAVLEERSRAVCPEPLIH